MTTSTAPGITLMAASTHASTRLDSWRQLARAAGMGSVVVVAPRCRPKQATRRLVNNSVASSGPAFDIVCLIEASPPAPALD